MRKAGLGAVSLDTESGDGAGFLDDLAYGVVVFSLLQSQSRDIMSKTTDERIART